MLETFIALLVAHILADFFFQPRWLVKNKARLSTLFLHGLIVAFCAIAALGIGHLPASSAWLAVLCITFAHITIDGVKTLLSRTRWGNHRALGLFIGDQIAHLVSISLIAWWLHEAWNLGHWAELGPAAEHYVLTGLCLLGGLVLITRAGGFFVAILLKSLEAGPIEDGLERGGAWIGFFERLLIFFFVLVQQYPAIGLLIAAKSILRLRTNQDRNYSEMVIIGTLASFTWAIITAWLTLKACQFFLARSM